MTLFSNLNKYDRALLLLIVALFSGNMGGLLLLPRTFSILFLHLLINTPSSEYSVRKPKSLLIVWMIWAFVSLVWTPDISEGFEQLIILLFNILYAFEILLFSIYSSVPLKIISYGWLTSLMLNNAVGLWEILTDNHLSVSKYGSDHQLMVDGTYLFMRYANGFFSNYNAFVTFICCALPFLYYLFKDTRNKIVKLTIIGNLLVSMFILFMNGSRGGVIALAVISVVYMFRLVKAGNNKKLGLALFAILGAFLVYYWDTLSYIVIGRQLAINSIEEEARYSVWTNCFKVLFDSFFLGTGVGGVIESMMRVAGPDAVLAPHNAFLEILVQYGILVFSLFLLFIKDILVSTKQNTDQSIKTIVYSSLLAMPFIFVINSMNLINPYFWAFMVSLFVFAKLNNLVQTHPHLRAFVKGKNAFS